MESPSKKKSLNIVIQILRSIGFVRFSPAQIQLSPTQIQLSPNQIQQENYPIQEINRLKFNPTKTKQLLVTLTSSKNGLYQAL